jgi:hypothetical protein
MPLVTVPFSHLRRCASSHRCSKLTRIPPLHCRSALLCHCQLCRIGCLQHLLLLLLLLLLLAAWLM